MIKERKLFFLIFPEFVIYVENRMTVTPHLEGVDCVEMTKTFFTHPIKAISFTPGESSGYQR